MTLNKVLIDSHVRVDINLGWYSSRDPEENAKRLESAAKDVKEFVRDHRSMDINDVYVVREYGYKCSHCGWIYETDPGTKPECCETTIREWASQEELVYLGYEEDVVEE